MTTLLPTFTEVLEAQHNFQAINLILHGASVVRSPWTGRIITSPLYGGSVELLELSYRVCSVYFSKKSVKKMAAPEKKALAEIGSKIHGWYKETDEIMKQQNLFERISDIWIYSTWFLPYGPRSCWGAIKSSSYRESVPSSTSVNV